MKYSEILKKVDSFIIYNLGIPYFEPSIGSWECVAGVKKYSKDVFDLQLGSFGGTAHTGWLNTNNTFDLEFWTRTEYKPGKQPPVGSIVFFKPTSSNKAGHVGFCRYRLKDITKIGLVEQNGIAGGKNQPGDEYNLRVWSLNNCSGRYMPKISNLLPN